MYCVAALSVRYALNDGRCPCSAGHLSILAARATASVSLTCSCCSAFLPVAHNTRSWHSSGAPRCFFQSAPHQGQFGFASYCALYFAFIARSLRTSRGSEPLDFVLGVFMRFWSRGRCALCSVEVADRIPCNSLGLSASRIVLRRGPASPLPTFCWPS